MKQLLRICLTGAFFLLFEGLLSPMLADNGKSDKEILELTILAMIFIYSLTEALTFSLVISIVTLIYGLVKKSNPLIVFGIITFVISMIVNLFRIFDNLALVFIILGFGIALISYVFYKETKKNKN